MKILYLLLFMKLLTACATASDSTLLGSGIGAAVGAGVGTAAGQTYGKPVKGALIGAAAGAAIGGLAGWSEFKNGGKSPTQSLSLINGNGDTPALTIPQVRRVWTPDKIENDKYIAGHYIYIIERPSSWRMNEKEKEKEKKND